MHQGHDCGCGAHGVQAGERARALLQYMLEHNKSHAAELHELAHSLGGEAQTMVHEAVARFEEGNEKLTQALTLLQEG